MANIDTYRDYGKHVIYRHAAKVAVRAHATGVIDIEVGSVALRLNPRQAADLSRLLAQFAFAPAPSTQEGA